MNEIDENKMHTEYSGFTVLVELQRERLSLPEAGLVTLELQNVCCGWTCFSHQGMWLFFFFFF